MNIEGIIELSSTLIKLHQSKKCLLSDIYQVRKRDDVGSKPSRAIISKGMIRTDLASISSICMSYAAFSYMNDSSNSCSPEMNASQVIGLGGGYNSISTVTKVPAVYLQLFGPLPFTNCNRLLIVTANVQLLSSTKSASGRINSTPLSRFILSLLMTASRGIRALSNLLTSAVSM